MGNTKYTCTKGPDVEITKLDNIVFLQNLQRSLFYTLLQKELITSYQYEQCLAKLEKTLPTSTKEDSFDGYKQF